jgi:hypothetical protein
MADVGLLTREVGMAIRSNMLYKENIYKENIPHSLT